MSVPATTRPSADPCRPGRRLLPRLPAAQLAGALRAGAAFAAFFGTLWFVQGAAAAGLPFVAAGGIAVALGIVVGLWVSRTGGHRPAPPVGPEARRAQRWINRSTLVQLVVSVPGAVAVQLLVDPTVVIPFVVVTVGLYLLALAPVVGAVHLRVAGGLLVAIPVAVLLTVDGTDRVLVTGLAAGTTFLAKGVVDLVLAVRHRSV